MLIKADNNSNVYQNAETRENLISGVLPIRSSMSVLFLLLLFICWVLSSRWIMIRLRGFVTGVIVEVE